MASKTTIDHGEIKKWVESRGGHPARVKATGGRRGSKKADPGILRVDYPGYSGEQTLEAISWDEWFDAFEENDLAFVYQDGGRGRSQSRFSRLVSRDGVATAGRRGAGTRRTTAAAKRGGTRRAKTTARARAKTGSRAGVTAKRSTAKRSTAKRATAKRSSTAPRTRAKTGAARTRKTGASRTRSTGARRTSSKRSSRAGAGR